MPISTWRCVRRRRELMGQVPHYADAFSLIPGRRFHFVSIMGGRPSGGPNHCPEPPRWQGVFRARDGRRYAVRHATTIGLLWNTAGALRRLQKVGATRRACGVDFVNASTFT
jgi:hypothetical protein